MKSSPETVHHEFLYSMDTLSVKTKQDKGHIYALMELNDFLYVEPRPDYV